MKDKLEPNMYVRTKDGIILKVNDIEDIYTTDNIFVGMCIYDNEGHFINDVEITKASHNIIDLIEENDYINGLRVEKNKYRELYTSYVYYGGDIGKQCEVYTTWLKDYKIEDIETIVTHEQIEQMEYRLGDDK